MIIYKKVKRKVKKIRAVEKRITVEICNGRICNKTCKVPVLQVSYVAFDVQIKHQITCYPFTIRENLVSQLGEMCCTVREVILTLTSRKKPNVQQTDNCIRVYTIEHDRYYR